MQAGNAVGKLTTSDGKFRIVPMPASGSRPYGIAIDSKDRPWFDEFGANRIGTVDPVSFKLTEYTISNPSARPRRIVITPDDKIFVGDYARGMLVRLDPVTGKISEWANPSGANSGPYAMAGDNTGRVWQVETGPQPNQFVAFDPKSEKFGTPVPIAKSGGLVVRHMVFDPKSRSIWFGTDANTIGRAQVGARRGGQADALDSPRFAVEELALQLLGSPVGAGRRLWIFLSRQKLNRLPDYRGVAGDPAVT